MAELATVSTILGALLLLAFVWLIASIGCCAGCDRQYLGLDDEVFPDSMIGTGWPAGRAEPSRAHADRLSADGGDGDL